MRVAAAYDSNGYMAIARQSASGTGLGSGTNCCRDGVGDEVGGGS
jgi:hypothetical protein